jgi:hypothetical protein
MRTFPSASKVAVCLERGVVIGSVATNVFVDGSYTSALASVELPEPFTLESPPAIKTFPSGSRVAVWLKRDVVISPVAVKVPVAGSYSSAVAETEKGRGAE